LPAGPLSIDDEFNSALPPPECDLHAEIYAMAPVGIGVIDRDTCVLSANEKFADLLGHTIDDLIGRYVIDIDQQGAARIRRNFMIFDGGGTVPDHQFVRDERVFQVSVAPYRDAHGHVCAIIVSMAEVTEEARTFRQMAEANRDLSTRASRDGLTGLYNRAYFEEALQRELKRMQRGGDKALSLVLADVDYFKQYNDHYGHVAGDNCLIAAAGAVQSALLRPVDLLSRYGGEELIAILADTDADGARRAAERMREAVAALQAPHSKSPFGIVTASFGVATITEIKAASLHEARDRLVEAADRALYRAKHEGRNRTAGSDALPSAGR
jgi:diguanylate cyclase (GGDEF)-like protein/PAS domain S-box-containing protein